MSTVNREDLEGCAGHTPNPTRNVSCLPIPRGRNRIAIVHQSRLAFGKIAERPKRDPGVITFTFLNRRPEKIADDWNRKNSSDCSVYQQRKFEQKGPP
jgi:hypothetical protein